MLKSLFSVIFSKLSKKNDKKCKTNTIASPQLWRIGGENVEKG